MIPCSGSKVPFLDEGIQNLESVRSIESRSTYKQYINTLEKEIASVNLTTRLIKSRKTVPKAIDTEGDDSVVKTTGKNRCRV